jgi:hypothetical protein
MKALILTLIATTTYFAVPSAQGNEDALSHAGRLLPWNDHLLREDQRLFRDWSNNTFGQNDLNMDNYDDAQLAENEHHWIKSLQQSSGSDSFDSINRLALIKSHDAFPYLLAIASDRTEGNNRNRWAATRALGLIGNKEAVPELIHLTYHYNQNTRLWAQISLVRLTGVNFGREIKSWKRWWDGQDVKTPFLNHMVQWTTNSELSDPSYQEKRDSIFILKIQGGTLPNPNGHYAQDGPPKSSLLENGVAQKEEPVQPIRVEQPKAVANKTSAEALDQQNLSKPSNDAIMNSLVIVETKLKDGGAMGSGFLTMMAGKKYFVSNQHVFNCADQIELRSLSGENIRPLTFEVCPELDLVRMEITNNLPTLTIRESMPEIGSSITVYGNSGGKKVVTELNGVVQGIGADLIEVSAEFVGGNSGCPILDTNALVVGVATFAYQRTDPEDWVSKDTRFQEIRRFGLRLNNCHWTEISPYLFVSQCKQIADVETALIDARDIWKHLDKTETLTYYLSKESRATYIPEKEKYHYEKFYEHEKEFYRELSSAYKRMCDTYNHIGSTEGKNDSIKRIFRNSVRKYKVHVLAMKKDLEEQWWVSQYLKGEADTWIAICDYLLQ